jgi:hypothetical protein
MICLEDDCKNAWNTSFKDRQDTGINTGRAKSKGGQDCGYSKVKAFK